MCLLSALEKSAVEALSGEKYWQRFSFVIYVLSESFLAQKDSENTYFSYFMMLML